MEVRGHVSGENLVRIVGRRVQGQKPGLFIRLEQELHHAPRATMLAGVGRLVAPYDELTVQVIKICELPPRPEDERRSFLLIVPFITDSIRTMVEQEKVSCIDLSGNYLIQSTELLAIRLDRKNRFPESAPIKKIFSGNSSQVGRLFLREQRIFESVGEIFDEINRSTAGLSLSAVSKVLSGMAEEMIIEKSPDRIVLLQPEKLLDRLREGYTPAKTLASLKLKIPGTPDEILKTMARELGKKENIWMLSGESSASYYASTTPPAVFRAYSFQSGSLPQYEVTRFFSDDRAELENDRFYNVVLEGRTEPFIFFDRQTARNKVCWASRLQTYLELSNLDKREREIAESIREGILKEFK